MKKFFVLIFVTANLAAMDHTDSRMALSFILNPDNATPPSIERNTPEIPEMTDVSVGQKRPRSLSDSSTEPSEVPAHKRTQTQEKRFKCTYLDCPYAAVKNCDLTAHMRIHTGEKPFKCPHPDCSYAAATNNVLTNHMRIHTGEKPYKCPEPGCTYAAAQNGGIIRHKRIHTGEKPFKCLEPGCFYAAARSDQLKAHMSTHNKDHVQ